MGEVINGGFGLLIDGSTESEEITFMLDWDVNNGISRRAWARNEGAIFAIKHAMSLNDKLKVTLPNKTNEDIINSIFDEEAFEIIPIYAFLLNHQI